MERDEILFSSEREKDFKDQLLSLALELFGCWVCFAPLSRGSAATGYVLLYAIFMAAGYQIESPMPTGIQMDWEAILVTSLDDFVTKAKSASWVSLVRSPLTIYYTMGPFEFTTPRQMIAYLNISTDE